MSFIETIANLNLDPSTQVTLTMSEGTDVFVHNESEVETALSETDVVNSFAELISTPGLNASTQYGYDVDLIEYSTEKYDHKRGFCTLTATVNVSVDNLLTTRPFLMGWEVSVPTENGTLTLN